MKKLVMAVLITATTIATTVNAQPPVPGAPPPPDGRGMRRPRDGQLQQATQFQGSVLRMGINDDYVYDGFYILSGSDSLRVNFPPHLGTQIVPLVKNGANVTVSGVLDYPPYGGRVVRMISVTAGGKTVYDAPPATPPVPPVETFVSASGKIVSAQTGRRDGQLNGFMLDNNTILRVPPPSAYQLSSVAQNGATVSYTGMQKSAKQGEAASANYTIVRCNTITVNGQQYIVGGPGGPGPGR
jgi:hypothetical protein